MANWPSCTIAGCRTVTRNSGSVRNEMNPRSAGNHEMPTWFPARMRISAGLPSLLPRPLQFWSVTEDLNLQKRIHPASVSL